VQVPLAALGTQAAGLLNYLGKAAGFSATGASRAARAAAGAVPADPVTLGQYDLRQITPRQFGQLVQQLYRQGMISQEEYRLLGELRLELDRQGYRADEPLDLVEYLQDRLQEVLRRQSRPGEEDPVAAAQEALRLQRQLLWVQKYEQHRRQGTPLDQEA